MKWGHWILSYDGKPHHRHFIVRHNKLPFVLYFPDDSKCQWFYKKQGILFCIFAIDDYFTNEQADRYFNYLTEYEDDLQQVFFRLEGTDIPLVIESHWTYNRHLDRITFIHKKTGDRIVIPKFDDAIDYYDWAGRHKVIFAVD